MTDNRPWGRLSSSFVFPFWLGLESFSLIRPKMACADWKSLSPNIAIAYWKLFKLFASAAPLSTSGCETPILPVNGQHIHLYPVLRPPVASLSPLASWVLVGSLGEERTMVGSRWLGELWSQVQFYGLEMIGIEHEEILLTMGTSVFI